MKKRVLKLIALVITAAMACTFTGFDSARAADKTTEGNPLSHTRRAVWYDNIADDWSIPDDYRFYQAYRLKDSFILPSPAGETDGGEEYVFNPDGVNAIKQQMYENHRCVLINFLAESYLPGQDTSKKEFMSDKWAHYTNTPSGSNHAVTIVGWDDNYPKENFLEGKQLPADGAFLIRERVSAMTARHGKTFRRML